MPVALLFFCPFCQIVRRERAGVDIRKRRALKARLQRPGHGAIKDSLAGNALAANGRAVVRHLRRVELVAANADAMRLENVAWLDALDRPEESEQCVVYHPLRSGQKSIALLGNASANELSSLLTLNAHLACHETTASQVINH